MAPYGALWGLMEPHGWLLMPPYGALRLAPYGALWSLMEPYGHALDVFRSAGGARFSTSRPCQSTRSHIHGFCLDFYAEHLQ